MNEIVNFEFWKCFAEEFPKDYCGVLIKINDPKGTYLDDGYDTKNNLYYGYSVKGRIQIILNITQQYQCSWKVTNSCELEDIYWYYHSVFSSIPRKENPLDPIISEYGKYICIKESDE